jgi:error-prone DNA polymerase
MKVSASTHIMAPFWEDLEKHGFIKSTTLKWKSNGSMVKIAGRVIIIHTPPTKSGKRVMFLTLEDEDGLFDLTVFEDVHTRYAKKILSGRGCAEPFWIKRRIGCSQAFLDTQGILWKDQLWKRQGWARHPGPTRP